MILRQRLLFAICTLSLVCLFCASAGAQCCKPDSDSDERWGNRLRSAEQLIADGREWQTKANDLAGRVGHLAAKGNSTNELWSQYQSLFQQYEQLLSSYRQHRQAYSAHVQSYHNMQSSVQQVNGSLDSVIASDPSNAMKPIKVAAQDKCAELQQLESSIINNETKLGSMMDQLYAATQKESASMFASLWSQANSLAMQDSMQANQFNHMGLLKTAQNTRSVHDLIAEANRDGAYNAHMQAYKDLSQGSTLEHEIYKRSNEHSNFAMSTLSKLAQMKPQGFSNNAPPPDTTVYSSDDLLRESHSLDQEYANVQALFQKLEAVRKALPPNLQGRTAGN